MQNKYKMFSKFSKLASFLNSELSGQSEVLTSLSKGFIRGECKLTNQDRPRGNFLLLGPTGVGKTESIKLISKFSDLPLLKINMSEFSELAGNDVLKKLIGAPNSDNGLLGQFLERTGEGIILYDELEKAHPDLFTILLQQLDDAEITLGDYKKQDLSNFYIICTSNVGAKDFQNAKDLDKTRMMNHALDILREQFSPEFIGRFGLPGENILTFKALSGENMRNIAVKFITKEIKRLKTEGLNVSQVSSQFIENCISKGGNAKSGARDMRNTVEQMIQEAYLSSFAKGCLPEGRLGVDKNNLPFIDNDIPLGFPKLASASI